MIKKVSKIVVLCLTVILFALSLTLIILGINSFKNNKPLSIFGYVYSVVPTESMLPEINPGDIVLSKKVDFSTIEIGDDVIYYSQEKNSYIVHRVLRQNPDGSFVMKGINNPLEDTEFVDINNYISKVVWVGSFMNIGSFLLGHRNLLFLGLIFIFLVILFSEGAKIFLTLKQKQSDELDEKYTKITEEVLADERQKMREQLMKEIEAEIETEMNKKPDTKVKKKSKAKGKEKTKE